MKTQIESLVDKFGHIRVNLPEDTARYGTGNGEGVWAVPCSKEDSDIAKSESAPDHKKEF